MKIEIENLDIVNKCEETGRTVYLFDVNVEHNNENREFELWATVDDDDLDNRLKIEYDYFDDDEDFDEELDSDIFCELIQLVYNNLLQAR